MWRRCIKNLQLVRPALSLRLVAIHNGLRRRAIRYRLFGNVVSYSTSENNTPGTSLPDKPIEISTFDLKSSNLDLNSDNYGGGESNDKKDNEEPNYSNERQSVWQHVWSLFLRFSDFVVAHSQAIKYFSALGAFFITLWKFEAHFGKAEKKVDSMPRLTIESSQQLETEAREKLFSMLEPELDFIKLERTNKENAWKKLVYTSLLRNPSICWVYGAKRVGKSTMLQSCTYALQQELAKGDKADLGEYRWVNHKGASKFEVFYVNLEEQGRKRLNAEHLVDKLCDQIEANKRDGKVSLVVVDSIGAMFKHGTLTEDMTFEEFEQEVNKTADFVPEWTMGFFRFVKAMYDNKTASFIFVTSKPLHYVSELKLIDRYMFGNMDTIDIDSKDETDLSLDLSDAEIVTYVKSQAPSLTDEECAELIKEVYAMAPNLNVKRIGYLQLMVGKLARKSKWGKKFLQKKPEPTKK